MKSIFLNRFQNAAIAACVLAVAVLSSCSSDSGPVASSPINKPGIARPTVTYENPLLPPVRIEGLQCFAGGGVAVCSSSGFAALRPQANPWKVLNTGRSVDLNAVWGTSESDFYIVGDQGCFLHWDGTGFTDIDIGTQDMLLDVWGASASDIWISGQNILVHWDGATATTFPSSSLPGSGPYYGIGGSSSANVYAVGSQGRVLHWDGASWSLVTTGLGTPQLNSVYVLPNQVFIAGDDRVLWHFDGTSWASFTATSGGASNDFDVVSGTGPNRVFAFGEDALMYRWDGTAWNDISDPFFSTFQDLSAACVLGTRVVVGGSYSAGSTNVATFDGTAWAALEPSSVTDAILNDAWTFMRDNAYAVGDAGTVLHRDATGWSTVPHGLTTERLKAVWASSPANVYTVGELGTVLQYNGSSWSIVNTGLGTATLYDIFGNRADNVWTIGSNALWHWDGATWTDHWGELPESGAFLNHVYVTPGGDVFLAGSDDFVHFDGTTWTTVPIKMPIVFILTMLGVSDDDVWLSDIQVGVLRWNGHDFEVRWPGREQEYVLAGRSANNVLAASYGELVQFAAGIPNVTPFVTGSSVISGHTGEDGTTYFVGYNGVVARVE
ncbi:MAG: hypothetical protein OEX18_14650 [Candidatus Krumholzibacteria bacterium]|nr:hypothetical protein [Candidatus Krumholzibacteria bacterium]MDH4338509.1 hypothetical protein [Candidatus Krumholzibacteria bacterium]MDH5269236.1 hypothetical protein [Candidatus Krumholzibacteria bacterium]